ncbi:hypothetical protein R3Q59_41300 [Rhodococcus jostii]|uniref:Transposase n=1 Tax=Rhodococcus jostii TaxID=132919 RepID=A0ABU4CUL4_RHOJO|nr:hypothetical protein [Rhodococcus jostii]MDV6286915.1 hypothetical protein [Rhodococcus jostii]
MRKLRRSDELVAEGKNGEEIAAALVMSAGHAVQLASPVLRHGRRRREGLKKSRKQNSRLKRLLADAELEKDALREIAKGKF